MNTVIHTLKTLPPASLAFLLIRLWLGLRLFLAALMKAITPEGGFSLHQGLSVHEWMLPMFEKSIIPNFLLVPYAHSLMWIELVLGVTVLLGIKPKWSLVLTGLTFLSLAFGQLVLNKYDTANAIGIYVVVTALAVYLLPHSRLNLVPDKD